MPALVTFQFRKDNSFQKRKAEAERVLRRFPTTVPIIVERLPSSKLAKLERKKFLVGQFTTCSRFKDVIRHLLKLPADEPLYLFIDMMIPQPKADLGSLHKEYCEPDKLLYMHYSDEDYICNVLQKISLK